MENCKNCGLPIDNHKQKVTCQTCGKPLHADCAIKDGGVFCDVCYMVKGETQEIKVEVPNVIRRSYIELWLACPYAFYLQVIKGINTAQSSFAQIGIDLHDLFHHACLGELTKGELTRQYEEIYKSYDDKMFEGDLGLYKDMTLERFKEKMWQQSLDGIDTFFEVLKELPQTALALEENIIFNVGEDLPNVSITMDRVDEIDGMLYVRDWKTGAVKIGQKLSSDLQVPLYIYAIREHFKKPVQSFKLYYLHENKTREYIRVDDDNYVCTVGKREYKTNITDAIRTVQHVFSQINKGNFNLPRNIKTMYFTCKTCGFKREQVCKGADVQSWHQAKGGWGL